MGEYMGSSLYHEKNEKCPKCGMTKTKSNGCCQDTHKFVQLKREHNQTKISVQQPKFVLEIIIPKYNPYNVTFTYPTAKPNKLIYPPPLIQKRRLHLTNCVFLI